MTTTNSDDGDRWIWSNDERVAGLPDTPAPVPCEFCGAMRYHKGFNIGERITCRHTGPSGAPVRRP